MRNLLLVFRLLQINYILARYRLDRVLFSFNIFRSFRFFSWFNPWNWRKNYDTRGKRIRLALEALGPIFVKFGQTLSTRRDLLPADIADELALLQDRVPPFAFEQVSQILQLAYGEDYQTLFTEFSIQPLASASIAQVHTAKLPAGSEVIVKIVRPGIKKIINRDIELLHLIASLAERYWQDGPRLHPVEVVAEFERTLLDELDLKREAANASQLKRNFSGSNQLYVPEIHWEHCRDNVLVMERIYGIRVNNISELIECGIDLKKLAERGVEIFYTQVFRDSFFHADMHPGNIFISYERPHDPQYIAVDFGIMGSLNAKDQRYLAENMVAFFNRDYRRVAELHVESGWVPIDTRIDEFEAAIRTVCEPIFQRPLKDISFGQTLLKLFQTARRFNMEVQPQLILLQKTLFNIEGLGRQLYPELDLWTTGKPHLERWIKQQLGPRALLRKICEGAPYWAEKLPEIPDLIYDILRYQKQRGLEQDIASTRTRQLGSAKQRKFNPSILGFGAGCLLSSTLFSLAMHPPLLPLSLASSLIIGLAGIGSLGIIYGIFSKKAG
ncbi:MAG: ubiB [Gammaproteobacteria bacterium]|nr:ubiB [Gammaproteobacteria bacterium]